MVAGAHAAGITVRGYVSMAFHSPDEGRIDPQAVAGVVLRLVELGVDEVSLGDTIGKASPPDVRALLELLLKDQPAGRLALHLHDTYGLAIANALTAWDEFGITAFDAAAGGFGGCPYAGGATGNVSTEDLVHALRASGAEVLVDGTAVVAAARIVAHFLGRPLASRLANLPAA